MAKASTGRVAAKASQLRGFMGRLFFFVLLLGLAIAAIGVVVLGAFPPSPTVTPVQKVLPNDRFGQPN